jgi:formamidopyrimidine-DNA glycosylase
MLVGKTIGTASSLGGMLNIQVEAVSLLFGDGVNLRFHQTPAEQPPKHQLLIEFEDATSLSASVAMYGGLWCFPDGCNDNPYYLGARDKPSPLSDGFNEDYFFGLFQAELENLSLKAFLATQQRIPGLGNGVLQDILYQAGLHPKRKVASLGQAARGELFQAIKTTLSEMTENGGRDTEKDLYGNPGGYQTRVSKKTVGKACPNCGTTLQKQNYMGGSIYFCPGCQKES